MDRRPKAMRHILLALAVIAAMASLGACKRSPSPAPTTPAGSSRAARANETADDFIARVNEEFRDSYSELSAAQWISSTYINNDSEMVAAKANERWLTQLNGWIEQARRFEGQPMSPATARSISLLKLMSAMPAPRDPRRLSELTRIASRMEGMYGAGRYCPSRDRSQCKQLGDLEEVLGHSRDYDAQLDAWNGWHGIAPPMRKDYVRFVQLVNEGAKDMGFADAGEVWRSGYDMPPARVAAETDRLWSQVKPLYTQLHCYARTKLDATYGQDKGEVAGHMLPAHLMGNMWQQDWSNLWDLLQPYPDAGSLDITSALQRQYQQDQATETSFESGTPPSPTQLVEADRAAQLDVAKQMASRAQDFYVSLGMRKLPDSYWAKSQFIKPRDRDVLCHASAWDMNMAGDVRTKLCMKPDEESFTTIYHELGHVYYDLAYNKLTPIFQQGAHDGFHEAIGDTIVLSMTPDYLQSIGLVDAQPQSHEALINAQMRMALTKVAFLPFGLMIDRWRWGVFDGSIKPSEYNQAWWTLKAKYQGVAPVTPRGEQFFDPGAKYHVAGNTPYLRYFFANILQFQFYKALCDASGYKGPLYACSFYGDKAAGAKYLAMLGTGASQPWQETLKAMTGSETMDASPLLEYFAPLQAWLTQQNEGQVCGWQAQQTTPVPETAASPAGKQG